MRRSHVNHGRLPWPHPQDLTPDQRHVYDAVVTGPRVISGEPLTLTDREGRLEGPFNAMLLNPALGNSLQGLGAAIRYNSSVGQRAREIAVLEVAAWNESDFEWYVHERLGRRAGLSDQQLDAIRHGDEVPSMTAEETSARDLVRSLLRTGDLGDELFDLGVDTIGLTAVTDLIFLVGYYQLLALAMRAMRTPLPADVPPIFGQRRVTKPPIH